MKQFLKTILLVSVLAIFIAGCAEEKSKSGQTNTGQTDTGQTDTGQQTPTTAEQVFTNFMTEFDAMQAVNIGPLTPSGPYLSSTTARITNTRTDNKDAYFIGLDITFKEFRGVKLDKYLIVTPNPQEAPGVLISANGSSNATFGTINSAPKGTHSSICALLTQEEYAVIEELLQAETALTVEQMQTVIDLVKPYVVKINYTIP